MVFLVQRLVSVQIRRTTQLTEYIPEYHWAAKILQYELELEEVMTLNRLDATCLSESVFETDSVGSVRESDTNRLNPASAVFLTRQ